MADLVRVSGAQEEAADDIVSSGSVGKLITDLVNHWDAVGTALALPDHLTPPRPTGMQLTLPPTQNDRLPDIDRRLSEQDDKIDQIITIFKSLESRIGTTLEQ